ncbi:MAG: hypothetical protein ACOYXT_28830 [Bacteroidota bacterium]
MQVAITISARIEENGNQKKAIREWASKNHPEIKTLIDRGFTIKHQMAHSSYMTVVSATFILSDEN